ncbi:TIGR02206 family membrane protein [Mariniflexile aquimaris]|uniref:TIGR02206 family membrane protein n=1 Tax=Mariniflexile aquimaris TaxID=881009 RepID=A0ABW3BVV4_9FLAO
MNFLIYNAIFLFQRVAIGSLQHIIPILIALVFCIYIIRLAKFNLSKSQQILIFNAIGFGVSLFVVAFHLYSISLGNYKIETDLPLYLCSLTAILIPVFTVYRKNWMYEILVFWIIAGTSQGVITPDILEGFPSFDYFRYWTVHLGLLTIIFYATFVFDMRPKLKSVFKSFFALQIYLIVMMLINYVLKANYFYLNEKPKSASVLDLFGEWPYYIMVAQLLLIPYFLIIYLPFYLANRNAKKN